MATNRVIRSILSLAVTVVGPPLLQVGCIDEAQYGETASAELITAQAGDPEEAGDIDALLATPPWTAAYISVQQPSGTIGPKVIDIRDLSTANGALAQLWQRTGADNQRWDVFGTISGGRNVYALVNRRSGRCLDMAIDGPVGNGTRVQQWDCNGTPNQEWIAGGTSGRVTLKNRQRPDLCLDVSGAQYV